MYWNYEDKKNYEKQVLLTLLILTLVWLGKCGIEKAAVSTEGIDVYLEERKTEMTQKNLNQLC